MSYSCTFAALRRMAKVCRRSWKSKSLISASSTTRSKQTIIWRRFLPVRVGSKINWKGRLCEGGAQHGEGAGGRATARANLAVICWSLDRARAWTRDEAGVWDDIPKSL